MLRSDSASAHPKSVVDHHSAVLRSIVGHVHRSKIRSGFSLQRSNSEVAHPKSGVELYSAALRSGCSTAIDSQERMMRFTNTGSQGPKLRRDSEAVLRSSSPLRRDVLRTTATGVHRSKIRSGLSLRATLLSAVFAFFVAVASGDSAVPSNACRTIKNAGYKIGFYLNGQAFSPTFNGAEIDLLQHYNTWALETRPTTFGKLTDHCTSAPRLRRKFLRSAYNAGEVIDLGDGLFHFDSHPNQTVRLDRWIHSEDGFNFTGEAAGFDFGPADPATVTLFHDIMFAGEKKFDVATRVEAANIDYRITYKERNHFDLTNWVSVNSGEDLETLIGVVDGKKVLRKECFLQKDTVVKTDCDAKVCNEAEIQRDVGSFCFSIAGCSIATGPQGLFDTVVVIPKDSIAKPTLPATSTAPTTTSTSTARYWKIPHRKPTPPATTLTSWMDFFNTLPLHCAPAGVCTSLELCTAFVKCKDTFAAPRSARGCASSAGKNVAEGIRRSWSGS
ncbi:hypothetical protein L596_010300 [Steinernema carpocapsae]|uniref:Uncharacterized protein n=1 Tax=Steinernema carpocapsae TaxID=34508 RepID=A0A4U5PIN1_STECR|nr:hypothetical protein L596_010300 [Steinernema carpocapsae]